jgi:hypothetical protein
METKSFSTRQIIFGSLIGGFFINLCDVVTTVTTVADDWNKVLASQGIAFNPMTPPYYISAGFIAGIILCWVITVMTVKFSLTRQTAFKASLLLWTVSRLYGMGHVVMGQMPLWIFIIMSAGLLLGFIAGGQMIYWFLNRRKI